MTRYRWVTCLVILTLPLVVPSPASAQQAWIVDILANPARHWNMTVTLVGQVQTVTADPVGTTRGTYQLLDDSCPNPIVVKTTDLPPVGKMFSVTGVIIQDPAAAGTPILKEVSRTTPGMSQPSSRKRSAGGKAITSSTASSGGMARYDGWRPMAASHRLPTTRRACWPASAWT